MKKLYSIVFIALAAITLPGYGQLVKVKPKQVVFVNGGQFQNQTGNVQVYDPALNTTRKLADFDVATSVQDIAAEGKYIWISADYNIIKYDLIAQAEVRRKYTQDKNPQTDDGTGGEGQGVNHSMTLHKDWLIVTRQFSSGPPEDGYTVRIYNKHDLSLVKKITISNQASDVVTVGDSAFVAINGGAWGATGKLAIIDLKNLQLKEEYNLGADGAGIMQMFHQNGLLYIVAEGKILTYNIEGHTHALHNVGVGHSDFSSSPLATTLIDNKLYAKTIWEDGQKKGFGTIDLNTFAIANPDVIGMHQDEEIQNNGYALMASVYDTEASRFVITFGQWWGNGIGRIYNANGTAAGSFGNVADSPERMVMSYEVNNYTPEVAKAFPQAALYAHESFSLDLTPYFKDAEGDALTYRATLGDGAALPAWITIHGSMLIATPAAMAAGQRWNIAVTASDPYNLSTTQTLTLKTGETTPLNQVVFVNGGQFQNSTGNVQLYDPQANAVSKLAAFELATSVQATVSEGKYVWISADYNIIKYDLTSKTEVTRKYTQDKNPATDDGTGGEGQGVNHSMTLYKDWLIATRQFSSGPPEDGYTVRIYNKSDLSLVKKITISNQAAGVVTVGDSAFVAINGGAWGMTGKLAIIDLKNLQLKQEYDFGADGAGIMQMFHKNGLLYIVAEGKILTYNIHGHTHALHSVGVGHSDFSSSPLATTIIGNKLYAKTIWDDGQKKGFGTIDLTTFNIVDPDLIGMSDDQEIQNNGYALMASEYDTITHRFYMTFGQWWGSGIGRIYNANGTQAGAFGSVEDSPERMTVAYGAGGANHNPYTTATVEDINVFEKQSRSLDVSQLFIDDDADAMTYSATLADGSALPAWMAFENNTLKVIEAPKDETITARVKIVVTDARGATTAQAVVIHVTPIDDAPVVAAPIADVIVNQGSPDQRIALTGVFADEDSDESKMTYTVVSNTHTALVTAEVNGSDLALSFNESQFGEAVITVRAHSGALTAEMDIRITVKEKVVTGIADETLSIAVFPNPVADAVHIRFGNAYHTASISLLTAAGATVVSKRGAATEEVLDVRALPAGVYLLTIRTPEGDVKKKLIKN